MYIYIYENKFYFVPYHSWNLPKNTNFKILINWLIIRVFLSLKTVLIYKSFSCIINQLKLITDIVKCMSMPIEFLENYLKIHLFKILQILAI